MQQRVERAAAIDADGEAVAGLHGQAVVLRRHIPAQREVVVGVDANWSRFDRRDRNGEVTGFGALGHHQRRCADRQAVLAAIRQRQRTDDGVLQSATVVVESEFKILAVDERGCRIKVRRCHADKGKLPGFALKFDFRCPIG